MKKSRKNLGMLVIALTFVLIVAGPVWSQNQGSLTITDIPKEYNGKFASFSYEMTTSNNKVIIFASADDASKPLGKIEGAVITNGSVKLLLFKKVPVVGVFAAYTGSDTVRVKLCLRDTAESDQDEGKGIKRVEPDFIFPSIKFDKGVASVKLSDAFKVGSITITGIPSVYSGRFNGTTVRFARPDEKRKNSTYLHETEGIIKNGTLTVKYYRGREEGDYTPYTGIVGITVFMGSNIFWGGAEPIKLLFKSVQVTNDNATIDFSQGEKQIVK